MLIQRPYFLPFKLIDEGATEIDSRIVIFGCDSSSHESSVIVGSFQLQVWWEKPE